MHGDYQSIHLLIKIKPDAGVVPARPQKVQRYISGYSVNEVGIFYISNKKTGRNQ
jgi:hypothetical protein